MNEASASLYRLLSCVQVEHGAPSQEEDQQRRYRRHDGSETGDLEPRIPARRERNEQPGEAENHTGLCVGAVDSFAWATS